MDTEGLKGIYDGFKYPLHFIDFETTMAAIPYYRGRRPCEQVAFQFSHHQMKNDGRVEHKDQYLCFERGKFPNFDFVRALRVALGKDRGTIFRYAAHENTVLNQIAAQLEAASDGPSDTPELLAFIREITRNGPREMVDLKWLVQKFYYHAATHGSNSIKAVLPAVLGESQFLQRKYKMPIYGAAGGIPSLNFKDQAWIELDLKGIPKDPYKSLKPVFHDIELPEASIFDEDDRIAEGGAAMTAYGRMQFTEMPDEERARVAVALLKYCELDTLAMVMIYEHWGEEIRKRRKGRSIA